MEPLTELAEPMVAREPVHLSIVVAAYNEEAVIAGSLSRIAQAAAARPGVSWELLCVDDGSTDQTGRLMEEFAAENAHVQVLHHRRNFGQGRALRTAFDLCRGEVIVTLDADLSYGPEYIYLLFDTLLRENVEIVLASPYAKGGSVRRVPFLRHLLSRLGNSYLARMGHYRISTSTCVVRAYHRDVIDSLVLTSDGMEAQMEILIKASMLGFRVCEVPAHLEWPETKLAGKAHRRSSKMQIARTMRLYLLLGWLARPAKLFAVLSLLLLVPAVYMAVALTIRVCRYIAVNMASGLSQAISVALHEVFTKYTYSVVFCFGLLLVGLQVLAFSMLMLQNKYYFDELYRMGQMQARRDVTTRWKLAVVHENRPTDRYRYRRPLCLHLGSIRSQSVGAVFG
ncbi:MAG TPA: glycosyltransferase family 2 protein [Armatimonadota bacterium]